jgi:CRP-like cAMP-binding protein
VVKVTLKRADNCELVHSDEVLKTAGLVKALGTKADAVLTIGVARRYPDRAVLFQQGDAGTSLFFVLRGEVRLSARKGADMVELGAARRGDVFGESEILSGAPLRTTSAVAQGDLDAVEIPREALLVDGLLPWEMAELLRPIKEARVRSLSDMTDFMGRCDAGPQGTQWSSRTTTKTMTRRSCFPGRRSSRSSIVPDVTPTTRSIRRWGRAMKCSATTVGATTR